MQMPNKIMWVLCYVDPTTAKSGEEVWCVANWVVRRLLLPAMTATQLVDTSGDGSVKLKKEGLGFFWVLLNQ